MKPDLNRGPQALGMLRFSGLESTRIGLVVAAIGIVCGSWTALQVAYHRSTDIVSLAILSVWFLVFSGAYLLLRYRDVTSWCRPDFILTVLGVVGFVVVPSIRVLARVEIVDGYMVKAIIVAMLGYLFFWIGNFSLKPAGRLNFVSAYPRVPNRVQVAAACMLVIGISANLLMWKFGLFSYTADRIALEQSMPVVQYIAICARLLWGALLVSAIDVFSGGEKSRTMKNIFLIALIASLLIGAISGMKSDLLAPLAMTAFVYMIIRRRIPRSVWLMIPLLLLVVYPFINAYRNNLNSGYRAQVNTVSGLISTLEKSLSDAFQNRSSGDAATLSETIELMTLRTSLLGDVREIVSLPHPELLAGDEKVYLAPFYPFIPRFIWPDKPILDKGQRISAALGIPRTSSTAPTLMGDWFTLYGYLGVMGGMFLYGAVLQFYTSRVSGVLDQKGLFFYVSTVVTLCDIERDVVSMVAIAVELVLVFLLTAWVVYGGKLFATSMASANSKTTRKRQSFRPSVREGIPLSPLR